MTKNEPERKERKQEHTDNEGDTLLIANVIDSFTVGDVLKLIEAIQEGDNNDI